MHLHALPLLLYQMQLPSGLLFTTVSSKRSFLPDPHTQVTLHDYATLLPEVGALAASHLSKRSNSQHELLQSLRMLAALHHSRSL